MTHNEKVTQMLEIHHRLGLDASKNADTTVVLDHQQRERGRLLLSGTHGEEVRLYLKRGQPLLVNELLQAQCGKLVKVEGAKERIAIARCDDWQVFARACYHLGNRHVKVQVDSLTLIIKPDHVLEDMLVRQGLVISHGEAVFTPESGAYQQGSHEH
jgi:urease accessory protein